ncbi:hypothetical protein OUZ56_012392 [Daphnia magna]|uniref:Lactosylceramide n=1 Tax=Daphnia magna TaxID=35525 RepID=A0ABQ9Z2V5_9CRUS|nr:hypothetical protein OUZ56_012392 [Daphnia magna]
MSLLDIRFTQFCSRYSALALLTFVHIGTMLVLYRIILPTWPYQSTCSHAADIRGPHQRIIGYSIYGDLSQTDIVQKYLIPFKETLKIIPVKYPGWIVRIYHNLTADDTRSWDTLGMIVDLERNGHVDLCNATDIINNRKLGDIFAMTWRWLPLLDPMVDVLMSRDSDSRIIPREEHAVYEWLDSDKIFHIMRDHPWHCRYIVGCCWGVKLTRDRTAIVDTANKLFSENHQHVHDYDQKLLDRLVWPIAKTNLLAHDSYCCETIDFSQPFPTKRQDGLFIGWRALQDEELKSPCPQKCRPQNVTSIDWSYC